MFKYKERPYDLLFLTAILILVASFFSFGRTFDIHLHDTFYVFEFANLFRSAAILLLVLWILYLVTIRFLFSKVLIWIHIALAIVSAIGLFALDFYSGYNEGLAGMPRRYYDYSIWNTFSTNSAKLFLSIILVTALGLLTYILNLLVGLFKLSK